MKIRSSFVSNSSSSSYIIEFEDLFKTVTIAGEEISVKDFFDLIQSYPYDSETEMKEIVYGDLEDQHKLLERIDQMLEWAEGNDKEVLAQLKKDVKTFKKNGSYFARFNLSYHNHGVNFLYRLLKKYDLFKERYSTEG